MSKLKPAVERVGIATPENVARPHQSGNTPTLASAASSTSYADLFDEIKRCAEAIGHLETLFAATECALNSGRHDIAFGLASIGRFIADCRGDQTCHLVEKVEDERGVA